MSRRPCGMTPLVHAHRDGRLGDREVESLERHMSTCSECPDLARDVERIAELATELGDELPPKTELEQRRARLQLLREAATPPVPKPARARRMRWATALAAACVVGVVAVLGASSTTESAPPVELASWTQLRQPSLAGAGAVVSTLRATPDARYDRIHDAGLEQVRLRAGVIDLQVDRLTAGQRFMVVTGDAEVEVRGTDFSVTAAADALRAVEVREGSVEVRRMGESFLLTAGQSWRAPERMARQGDAPQTDLPPDSTLRAPTEPRVAAASPLRHPPERATKDPPGADPEATEPAAPAAAATTSQPPARDAAAMAFARGVALLETGDYAQAAQQLQAFSREHPDDPRAEDADFLVIVARQRAKDSTRAAQAARRFLDRHPDSGRRDQAASVAQGSRR